MTHGQLLETDEAARGPLRAPDRQRARQQAIVAAAMEQFAAHGYEGARIEVIARQAGVAKGAVFGYFTSKAGLFLAAYAAAARTFRRYLEAPPGVLARGFFAVLGYWLERTPHLIRDDLTAYRVTLLGNYCSDLARRRDITQFLVREDPYGMQEFIDFGIARGEVRADLDRPLVVSLTGWLVDRFQDAIVTQELDPGLFGAGLAPPQVQQLRVRQFVELLQRAIGTGHEPGSGGGAAGDGAAGDGAGDRP